ncbi:DNA mismatch repair endonuclease MutL [Bacteroidota bacterium]
MQNKIKILPATLCNKIAAGEVVNRPESVVKELLENSIDAGATEITLIVKDAGKSLVQVIDTGTGMDEEDAVNSFKRHSTSKISTYEDLENIQTLGFRGEALASICSISQVEMKTKTDDTDVGTLVRVDGNEVKEVTKTNIERGTSIAVRNLFYNTPGRRNFLKSNNTEFKHIYETFIKLAISNPDISFKFVNDDKTLFDIKQSAIDERLRDIYTNTITDSLIPVNHESSILKINGFISKPGFTKKAKQDQHYYLNNRYFNSKSLNFAVYSGYGDLIEKGDYPSFFLFIIIDPTKVDVNVHPSKLEVKFEEEGAVFGFIKNAIQKALKESDLVFDITFDTKFGFDDSKESFRHSHSKAYKQSKGFDSTQTSGGGFKKNSTDSFKFKPTGKGSNIHSIFEAEKRREELDIDVPDKSDELQSNVFDHKKIPESESFNVWQYQNKYVMYQTETGLMIIDQHAAHERILYEKALKWLESQSSFSQQLLLPINIKLSKIDYQIANSLKEELQSLGFNIKLLKDETVELNGIPSDVKIGDENKIFQELIDQFKEYELKLNLEKRDNLAKSFACRSAIRTGDSLSYEEMIGLIDKLFESEMPYVCPHGRPTIIRITTEELDKRFSRT